MLRVTEKAKEELEKFLQKKPTRKLL